MVVSHEWLWPDAIGTDPITCRIPYTFVSDRGDTKITNVTYDKSSGTAVIAARDGTVIEHKSFGRLVSSDAMRRLSKP